MKKTSAYTYLILLISFNSLFSQQVINKEVICPKKMLDAISTAKPNFFFDQEYLKNIKFNDSYSFHLLVKVPSNEPEARAIPNLIRKKSPKGAKLVNARVLNITGAPKSATITFKNTDYKPYEVVCVKIDGVADIKGKWNPKIEIFITGSFLGFEASRVTYWNGMNIAVN